MRWRRPTLSARATGKEARLIALAEAELPMLRSAAEFARAPDAPAIVNAREDIVRADHLVLVFPLWLGGAPALLHVFLEQIARGNFFAETSGAGISQRLKGKSARRARERSARMVRRDAALRRTGRTPASAPSSPLCCIP